MTTFENKIKPKIRSLKKKDFIFYKYICKMNIFCRLKYTGTMGNGALGNRTFQNVSGETGHFYYLGNGTFYSLGEGTLYSLGNGTFYPLGTILCSGNRDTYPLGIGPLILWESGHPLGFGT